MSEPLASRIDTLDWSELYAQLDANGCARTGQLLQAAECKMRVDGYGQDDLYRSTVVMARHNFGKGEYRYYAYALPEEVATLRQAVYSHLAPLANAWMERMGVEQRYPTSHDDFLKDCRTAGQERPTPLILRYGAGDYNCLHQDLYGDLHFPIQLAILLDEPGEDFDGGEFILTEQRPRMQSRARVIPLTRGEGVLFAVNQRPVQGKRGDYRVTMRHGVSEITRGSRHTLGVIFHDAR